MTTTRKPVNQFTRECAVKYDAITFTNAKTITNEKWEASFDFDYNQMNLAEDYLVGYIFGLSEAEIAKIPQKEFKELLEIAKKTKEDPLSETATSLTNSNLVWGREDDLALSKEITSS